MKVDGRGISGWAGADQVVLVEEASAFFERMIREKPRDIRGYYMRGRIAKEEKKDFGSALRDLLHRCSLQPRECVVPRERI